MHNRLDANNFFTKPLKANKKTAPTFLRAQ